jgi:hypothetical protein
VKSKNQEQRKNFKKTVILNQRQHESERELFKTVEKSAILE